MIIHYSSMKQPVIGILTMHDEQNDFRGNRENFIDIIRVGREMGIPVFVVTVRDLKLYHPKIYAFQYDFHQNTWKRVVIPLPQIIYNRIPNRNDELLPEVQKTIRDCIRHPRIQLFNPSFFNKWTLFEWLKQSKATKKHIPATRKLSKQLDLKKMLNRHRLLYLKPEKGKAGKGIMRLKRLTKQPFPYRLSVQENRKTNTYRFNSFSRLRQRIYDQVGNEDYIVQQGIVLAQFQQRPFDLRVLVQKNRKGQWAISGVGARVAGNLSITTHVPRGGSIDEPLKLLSSNFGTAAARKIMRSTKKTALLIAKQVERGSGHSLGEMSMDLGVDTSGHIWFFEANAKPMKFDEPHIRKKSIERLLHYCKYLGTVRKKVKMVN